MFGWLACESEDDVWLAVGSEIQGRVECSGNSSSMIRQLGPDACVRKDGCGGPPLRVRALLLWTKMLRLVVVF